MTSIQLDKISKSFDRQSVLDDVSLTIPSGSFFFLLGPSGCGKSTLLRIVSGLLHPDRGTVQFDGKDMTAVPAEMRNTNMVFQNYALWPHLSVFENVAFGLRVRGGSVTEQTNTMLALVRMEAFAQRYPHELSGGQQQRVALARALAPSPRIVLLDEPLSNLDAQLRGELRIELAEIHSRIGATFIFVTHDQEEALSMASHIAVLRGGRLEQVGSPESLYNRPVSPWIARFLGETNLLEAKVEDGGLRLASGPIRNVDVGGLSAGARVLVSVRPEHFSVSSGSHSGDDWRGVVKARSFLGKYERLEVALAGDTTVTAISQTKFDVGDRVTLTPDAARAVIVEAPRS